MVAMKTITERSMLLMILIIPAKKPDMPEIPAKSISITGASFISKANRKKTIDPTINSIDHFPRAVLGGRSQQQFSQLCKHFWYHLWAAGVAL